MCLQEFFVPYFVLDQVGALLGCLCEQVLDLPGVFVPDCPLNLRQFLYHAVDTLRDVL